MCRHHAKFEKFLAGIVSFKETEILLSFVFMIYKNKKTVL